MPTLEDICKNCLAVCQVPIQIPNDDICDRVKRHLRNGRILDTDKVDGIESGSHLTRLVLLCTSVEDVDYVCKNVREEEIQVQDKLFTVKYQRAIACELPERWENTEIPEEDSSKPQLVSGSADGQQQSHTAPEPPSRRPLPQKPSGGDQMHMHAWPAGPYGQMSGFYHNIPTSVAGYMQGDADKKINQGGIPQQMPVHGQGHVQGQGQHPMQGHRHQQGHPPGDAEHGQGAGQGPQRNYQFPPGAPGQFPGFPVFGMPPNFQPDHQKVPGQNMPFRPRIPMFFDPAISQYRPYPGYPMPQQQGQEGSGQGRHHMQQPTGPPPPYNGGQFQGHHQGFSTEVKSPKDRPDHGPGGHSQAVSDQDEVMKKLQAKLSRENQAEEAESQDAENVVKRGHHTVEGKKLSVSLYVPPVLSPSYEDKKILIKGLKPTTQDCLFNFIEAKSGLTLDTMDHHAKQEDVAESIDLDHISHNDSMYKDQSVNSSSDELKSSTDKFISELECQSDAVNEEMDECKEEPEMSKAEQTKIIVSNLPSSVDEEYLEMFFENKNKYGGGTVFHIDLDEETATAVVEFEEPEAVDIVLNKCPLMMMRQIVEVSVFTPQPFVPPCTIEISGPSSVVCEDQLERLEMYFDSEKRSGGGDVVECSFDAENSMALVTFGNEEVAQRVVERGNHKIKNENLKVKLHTPTKKFRQSKMVDKTDKAMEESVRTIKVKGVDKVDRDSVEFYFENSRRSGGGEIEKVRSDEEDYDVIYITFKNKQVAENVAQRNRHRFAGKELSVSLYISPLQQPVYENKILIKGFKPAITKECLFNFIEAKSGYIPVTMDYHAEQGDVVVVTFAENPDLQKLEKIFGKAKLEGATLKLYPVPISNCIIVCNLTSDITKDTVAYYFENSRKSGGGAVEKVVMNDSDTCLVYFDDYRTVDSVLDKKHVLSNQQLDVKRYQEWLSRPEEVDESILNVSQGSRYYYSSQQKEEKKSYGEEEEENNTIAVKRKNTLLYADREGTSDTPATWGHFKGNQKVVNLQNTDPEYKDIFQKFRASAGARQVKQINRIQNKTLWNQYHAKKKQLEVQNPANTQNEHFLWHGTVEDAVDSINAHGFNRTYCGKNATALGNGVYFAVQASYSCKDTYSRPDGNGVKRMYYCRVLTGEYTRGSPIMRVPPAKPTGGRYAIYDSVVDNEKDPGIYVIFNDTQAYPEYMVTFF